MAGNLAVDGSISGRLIEARGDLSRAAAAVRLGVHKNTLTNYEHGSRLPDAEILQALYREFGISPTWVLTGQEPKYIQPGIAVAQTLIDAIQKGNAFSVEQQRALADDDTFAAYLSGKRVPTPEFLAGFAELTGYPLARLNSAYELCQALSQMEEVAAQIASGQDKKKGGNPQAEPTNDNELTVLAQYRAADEAGKRLIERICDAVSSPSLGAWLRAGQALGEAATIFEKRR